MDAPESRPPLRRQRRGISSEVAVILLLTITIVVAVLVYILSLAFLG